jgi:hypothetical protein
MILGISFDSTNIEYIFDLNHKVSNDEIKLINELMELVYIAGCIPNRKDELINTLVEIHLQNRHKTGLFWGAMISTVPIDCNRSDDVDIYHGINDHGEYNFTGRYNKFPYNVICNVLKEHLIDSQDNIILIQNIIKDIYYDSINSANDNKLQYIIDHHIDKYINDAELKNKIKNDILRQLNNKDKIDNLIKDFTELNNRFINCTKEFYKLFKSCRDERCAIVDGDSNSADSRFNYTESPYELFKPIYELFKPIYELFKSIYKLPKPQINSSGLRKTPQTSHIEKFMMVNEYCEYNFECKDRNSKSYSCCAIKSLANDINRYTKSRIIPPFNIFMSILLYSVNIVYDSPILQHRMHYLYMNMNKDEEFKHSTDKLNAMLNDIVNPSTNDNISISHYRWIDELTGTLLNYAHRVSMYLNIFESV